MPAQHASNAAWALGCHAAGMANALCTCSYWPMPLECDMGAASASMGSGTGHWRCTHNLRLLMLCHLMMSHLCATTCFKGPDMHSPAQLACQHGCMACYADGQLEACRDLPYILACHEGCHQVARSAPYVYCVSQLVHARC